MQQALLMIFALRQYFFLFPRRHILLGSPPPVSLKSFFVFKSSPHLLFQLSQEMWCQFYSHVFAHYPGVGGILFPSRISGRDPPYHSDAPLKPPPSPPLPPLAGVTTDRRWHSRLLSSPAFLSLLAAGALNGGKHLVRQKGTSLVCVGKKGFRLEKHNYHLFFSSITSSPF